MGGNHPSIELECGGSESWKSDSEIGNFFVNRSVSNGYRDAYRSGDCDDCRTFAKTNLIRGNWRCKIKVFD